MDQVVILLPVRRAAPSMRLFQQRDEAGGAKLGKDMTATRGAMTIENAEGVGMGGW